MLQRRFQSPKKRCLWCRQVSRVGFVLKGYPRISETFIAQEIRGLEERGFDIVIYSMRPPREAERHPIVDEIKAPVVYLPERLSDDPARVARACLRWIASGSFWSTLMHAVRSAGSTLSLEPLQRWGQGVVLAADSADDCDRLHAHFLHSPALVCEVASKLRKLPWTCSAHAKDIWTLPQSEVRRKLAMLDGIVTCTRDGALYLRSLAPDPDRVHLVHHGIDLKRFSAAPRPAPDNASVRLLSVGRAVEKKGYDLLLDALAGFPADIDWTWHLIGDGDALPALQDQADRLGVSDRCTFAGAQPQSAVLEAYRSSDVFVLPSRVLKSGDRDGLPNVIMEAMSQKLPIVASDLPGIREAVESGVSGMLVAADQVDDLRDALLELIHSDNLRTDLGRAGAQYVTAHFSHERGLDALVNFFSRHGIEPSLAREKAA